MTAVSKIFTKKLVVGLSVVTTLLTIMGGLWKFDSHYASAKRVDGVEATAKDDIKQLEGAVASALKNQQYKADVRYYQIMDDKLREDIYQLRKRLERDPSDELLRQDYNDLKELREKIKDKLEDSMMKIRVN